jgi:hypothetical protein
MEPHAWVIITRWTARALGLWFLLAAIAVVPMTLAIAAKPLHVGDPPDIQAVTDKPAVQRRSVSKLVRDFPEKTDVSTPESALAAYHRAMARMDAQSVLELSWWKFEPREIEEMERFWKRNPQDIAIYNQAQLDAEVIEVLVYQDDLAAVISELKFPEGFGRNSYSSRSFGQINGTWKNLGEDRLPNIEAARNNFEGKKDLLWRNYLKVREGVAQEQPVSAREKSGRRSARIAPGELLGISHEKAELMGRVEWAFMHGARDVTARKSIEWGEVEKDDHGNRTIRYKCYATIWDKDVYVVNQVYTFDAEGNILGVEDVQGFPQRRTDEAVDVGTEEEIRKLVEVFFNHNYQDVTSRKTIEWGDVTKTEDGNYSIRYKYLAKIWDNDTKIMNQTFTFDPNGKFVSVMDVDDTPQAE